MANKISLKELIEMHHENVGGNTKKEIAEAIRLFVGTIHTLAEQTDEEEVSVTVPDLGTFTIKTRQARQGRNPRNPEEVINIPSKKALAFKEAKAIKDILN